MKKENIAALSLLCLGIAIGVLIQFKFQNDKIIKYRLDCLEDIHEIKRELIDMKYERNIYRYKLDRLGYPVEEMIKR